MRLPTEEELDRYVTENIGLWRSFPQELCVLLDPCAQSDFSQSLFIKLNGELGSRTDRGRETINTFSLNRASLVAKREARFDEYILRLNQGLSTPNSSQFQDLSSLFDFEKLEFGGTWYLLLRRLALLLGNEGKSRPTVSQTKIGQFFLKLYGRSDGPDKLENALRELANDNVEEFIDIEPEPLRRSQARLSNVRLENFKAIERLELRMPIFPETVPVDDIVTPGPSLLILGENAAGKSSILEAIALALSEPMAR